ncbi:MAG: hypothetical protein Q8M94_20130 [Ignavibacteria bacterium]|nr:hypothetical protein [Ignavibacteria bacterium]
MSLHYFNWITFLLLFDEIPPASNLSNDGTNLENHILQIIL